MGVAFDNDADLTAAAAVTRREDAESGLAAVPHSFVAPAADHEVALLALEIDRWRLIRDLLGVAAADVVSGHVARCVQASMRPTDQCFRTGPGQFLVVLDGTGHADAERIAHRVADSITSKKFTDIGPATISAAVAQRYPGESVGQWWKRLDSTLAQARGGGGNRIVVDRRSDDVGLEHAPGLHLEWQPRFECGDPDIDRQHRELFEQSEAILDAARRSGPHLVARVDALVVDIGRHFETEEAILEKHGYRGLEHHRRTHALLGEKAQRMQAAMAAGRVTREDLLRFLLGEVVADHMLSEDRLFAGLFSRAKL